MQNTDLPRASLSSDSQTEYRQADHRTTEDDTNFLVSKLPGVGRRLDIIPLAQTNQTIANEYIIYFEYNILNYVLLNWG